MNLVDKNLHYHNVLALLKKNTSEQDKAKEIVLYLEDVIKDVCSQMMESEEGTTETAPAKFGKTFRRVT